MSTFCKTRSNVWLEHGVGEHVSERQMRVRSFMAECMHPNGANQCRAEKSCEQKNKSMFRKYIYFETSSFFFSERFCRTRRNNTKTFFESMFRKYIYFRNIVSLFP